MSSLVPLEWQKFTKLTEARSRFARTSCVYVQTDSRGCPIRIGKASEGRPDRALALLAFRPVTASVRRAASRRVCGGSPVVTICRGAIGYA
jgi:hypothetical protein